MVCMYHIFFTHSSIGGHLGFFHVLAIVHRLQWASEYMYLFKLWFSPVIFPGVWLLEHMAALFSVWKGTSILFFLVAAQIYIPTNGVKGLPFLNNPCASCPSICLLWRNVYSDLPPIFWLGSLFYWYWAA